MTKSFDFVNFYELKLTESVILSKQNDCYIVILKIKN
jgi:hypothetical protein